MPDFVGFVGGIVGGIVGFVGDMVGTAVGAVMGYVGSVVEGLAMVAYRVVELLPDAADLNLTIPSGWLYGYDMLNTFLPISESLALVAIMVAVYAAAVLLRLGGFVYHLIPKPFIGT